MDEHCAVGGSLDLQERPSEAFDRKEIVLLAGKSRSSRKSKLLPIIRTDVGGFFGFGEVDSMDPNSFQGRFAGILPAKRPTKEMQNKA